MSWLGQYAPVDREAIWTALYDWLRSKLTASFWVPNHAYSVGDTVVDPAGHLQNVTVAGTSGAQAPEWNDAGGDTADGTTSPVTWQDQGQGFVSIGRKHKQPPNLGRAEQPAMFVVQIQETHLPKPPGTPTKLVLSGYLIIYVPAPAVNEDIGSEQSLAATTLNAIFKAIDAALQPDDLRTGKFTLGGLVEHCWIEGDTRQDPGILRPQAAAIVPIHILVP